jgi:hypothetical protein
MGAAHNHEGEHHHGHMDITDQKATFGGFVKVAEWGIVLTAMLVALLTFGFAMGYGWWVGMIGWVLIGLVAGLVLKMGPTWWATLIGSTGLMVIGGAITMAVGAFL